MSFGSMGFLIRFFLKNIPCLQPSTIPLAYRSGRDITFLSITDTVKLNWLYGLQGSGQFVSGCIPWYLCQMLSQNLWPRALWPFRVLLLSIETELLTQGPLPLFHKRYEGTPGNPCSGLHFQSWTAGKKKGVPFFFFFCEMVTVRICANFRDLFLREGFCL